MSISISRAVLRSAPDAPGSPSEQLALAVTPLSLQQKLTTLERAAAVGHTSIVVGKLSFQKAKAGLLEETQGDQDSTDPRRYTTSCSSLAPVFLF